MTSRVFVHLGPHKTGTTFLQAVLQHNKDALAADGVLFPGGARYSVHRHATQELLRQTPKGAAADNPLPAWDALAAEVRDWSGHAAVISHEGLAGARAPAIRRMVSSLAPNEVHLVYAMRDLTKVIPGGWSTRMRNGHSEPWTDFLAHVRDEGGLSAQFGTGQDPRGVFARWEKHVPRERIHVITVPPAGTPQQVLWQRFTSVVGLDADKCSLDVPRVNPSLGTAEIELLRRLNAKVHGSVRSTTYNRMVQVFIARKVLEQRPEQARFAMPAEEHEWLRPYAESTIEFLRREGYEVTGDLDDLLPAPPSSAAVAPDEVDLEQALDAATDVIAALLQRQDRRTGKGGTRRRAARATRTATRRTTRRAARGLRSYAGSLFNRGTRRSG